ncbi:MAG: hypothetical protein NVS2B6_00560 [Thermoleophilaceae bacterium]
MNAGGWSTQQLVEFLAAVAGVPDEATALRDAIEHAAEAVEAEIGVVIRSGEIVASIGFPDRGVNVEELLQGRGNPAERLEVPGLGLAWVARIPLEQDVPGEMLLARADEPFAVEEISLLRGMARVLTLTLRNLRLYAAERTLRKQIKIDAEKQLKRLRRAALTDNLTGLSNHRAFQEDLESQIQHAERSGSALGLVMLDLDGLKLINDSIGHQAGDERLQALSTALASAARTGDLVSRLGGDEFAVILPGENAWGALRFAQRVQELLAQQPAAGRASVTAGVADHEPGLGRDGLTRRADLALIEAKRSHRKALMYSTDIQPEVRAETTGGGERAAERHHQKTLATALARAVDAKDSYTRSHSETVSELCTMIGAELGLGAERLAALRLAGLLHDVGKIGIPDAILNKPDKLTTVEFDVMKTHATLGHSIVRGAELEREAGWILHHHERLDGRGYPDGLSGEAIALESRIILVADAFEAITSDRPYRKGRGQCEALAEIERNADTQFDVDCVLALKRGLGHPSVRADESLGTWPPFARAAAQPQLPGAA